MALLIGSLVTAAGLAICAVLPWFWLILVSSIAAGGGHGVQNVARQGIVQRRSPDAVRSRVFAAVEAIANVAFIASLAVAGAARGGDRPARRLRRRRRDLDPAAPSCSRRRCCAPAVRSGRRGAEVPQRVQDDADVVHRRARVDDGDAGRRRAVDAGRHDEGDAVGEQLRRPRVVVGRRPAAAAQRDHGEVGLPEQLELLARTRSRPPPRGRSPGSSRSPRCRRACRASPGRTRTAGRGRAA